MEQIRCLTNYQFVIPSQRKSRMGEGGEGRAGGGGRKGGCEEGGEGRRKGVVR